MNTGANNILDLLAAASQSATATLENSSKALTQVDVLEETPAVTFPSLFGLAMTRFEPQLNTKTLDLFESNTPETLQKNNLNIKQALEVKQSVSSLFGSLAEESKTLAVRSGLLPVAELSGTVTSDNEDQPIANRPQMLTITPLSEQFSPSAGKFQVQSQFVADGRVNLNIIPEDGESPPIRISFPEENLREILELRSDKRTVGRIPVNDIPRQTLSAVTSKQYSIHELLKQVRVRAIEISPASMDKADRSLERLNLKLTLSQGGREIVAALQLPRSALTIDPKATRRGAANSPVAAFTEESDSNDSIRFGAARQSAPLTRGLVLNGRRLIPFTIPDKLSGDGMQITESILERFANVGSLSGRHYIKNEFESSQSNYSVRFSLPQETGRLLNSSGKSVLIKIEPEHLGPARLHLTVQNNVLTARVTVESLQSRIAVESSLDKLTDQLNRVGIKVDQITVSVADGGMQQHFTDRRPNWKMSKQRNIHLSNDITSTSVEEFSRRIKLPPTRDYVNAEGVNLLA